jgi:uridine kinase
VAITGGSGSGKTWLAKKLARRLGDGTEVIGLDSFYRDLAYLSPGRRRLVNFDHPRAVDWGLFRTVMRDLSVGAATSVPVYDYTQHTRTGWREVGADRRYVLVDGLWLLRSARLRSMYRLRVFIDCTAKERLARRTRRDVSGRGRTRASVARQFQQHVQPMHRRLVDPQRPHADLVLKSPIASVEVFKLVRHIRSLESAKSD